MEHAQRRKTKATKTIQVQPVRLRVLGGDFERPVGGATLVATIPTAASRKRACRIRSLARNPMRVIVSCNPPIFATPGAAHLAATLIELHKGCAGISRADFDVGDIPIGLKEQDKRVKHSV